MRYSAPPRLNRYRPLVGLGLMLAAVIAVGYWLGTFRPVPAELRLALAGGAGEAASPLASTGAPAEPRFPLALLLYNESARPARPVRVSFNLPAVFRLRSGTGPLQRVGVPGSALVRYDLELAGREVMPGEPPEPLSAGDTLWLEPLLSDYYCQVLSDSVPEFVPAPVLPPSALTDVPIYYSFAEAGPAGRVGGLLEVRLDPAALRRQPAPPPPAFPTQLREPELPRPALGTLRERGTRTAECGDPRLPLELYTVTWRTAGGGRFLVVYVNGAPRKQLFDLDGDSIIELEMWDPDADGRFEARRAAYYPIPSFLLPERPPGGPEDAMPTGPEWEARFADTARGPFRFVPDSLLPAALRPRGEPADSAWLRRFEDVAAGPFRFVPDSLAPPPLVGARRARADSAWLRLFDDVAAGPFRFSDRPPPRRAAPRSRPAGLAPPRPLPDSGPPAGGY